MKLIFAFVLSVLVVNSVHAEDKAWPGKVSDFHGYSCHEFEHNGVACKVVPPKTIAEGKPWIWRARFWGHEPQTDLALLNKGYHVVYCDVAGLFGSPKAVQRWNSFYDYLTTSHQFHSQCLIEGMSRGGLISLNWAIANPQKVKAVYLDAPVCDFKSWPGGLKTSKGSPQNWQQCLEAYELTHEQALSYSGNPIDSLSSLAKQNVPILVVVGDADEVVPVSENTALLNERYKKLGGSIQVHHKPGVGHHPHSLEDPTLIVDFLLR